MFSCQRGVVSSWPEESHMSSNLNVNEFNDEKIHCSLNADSGSSPIKYEPFSEMVMWLRRIAIDPCNKKASSKSQCRRVLIVRKVLILNSTELPWKKRKHHQLLKESSTAATDSLQKPNEQCRYRSLTASVSCLINCTDSADSSGPIILKQPRLNGEMIHGDNLSRKRVLHEHSFQTDAMDWNRSSTKEHPILICSDDSCSGSNPPSPRRPFVQMLQTSVEISDDLSIEQVDISSKYQADLADRSPTNKQSPSLQRPVLQMLQTSVEILESGDDLSIEQVDISSKYQADLADRSPTNKQSPLFDSNDSVISSNESSTMTKFIGDSPSLMPIPIGPRFQADIPDWIGSTTNDDDSNSDNSRWLGTRVWPLEGKETERNSVLIGKGRPCSCSCDDLGSTKCIKQHLVEKRLQLRADLGPAYFIWKFNEMGEEVARSWTQKQQNSFDILVKTNPVSKNKSFLKPALKYFTSKCRGSIVSYYFNVAVLRRMSRRTRLDPASADSDDDEADGSAGYSKSRSRRLAAKSICLRALVNVDAVSKVILVDVREIKPIVQLKCHGLLTQRNKEKNTVLLSGRTATSVAVGQTITSPPLSKFRKILWINSISFRSRL